MKTTADTLLEAYDDVVTLLRARVTDKSATAADITNLLRILDKAAMLELLKGRPVGSAPNAVPIVDLPFTDEDDFADLRVAR